MESNLKSASEDTLKEQSLEMSPISKLLQNFIEDPADNFNTLAISSPVKDFAAPPVFTPSFGKKYNPYLN
ncbi:hypothetical protein SteCoe_24135 [Stentor coeruleus]|uniref:Uncharacterized protein n=1 Tax=Stentor coeruleus TaxID=5963 RepID=A0A1R2BIE6_9CILI|nr:hypothetical protein SteCoe_24135 [Stentor coeruleus]